MKTTIKDNKIIIFLNKTEIKKTDFKNNAKIEDYFKTIFLKLNNIYDLDINGYYNIDVYLDNNYGAILEIENEDLDYYNYFEQIDMKLNISKTSSFLYEIKYEFLDSLFLDKCNCYKHSDKIYLKANDSIEKNIYFRLLESSNVIYGEEVDNILKYGKKVKL